MRDKIYFIVVATLAAVILSVIAILLVGLFDNRIDNEKIFAILGPAFQTVVGCFVGVLGSKVMSAGKSPEQS